MFHVSELKSNDESTKCAEAKANDECEIPYLIHLPPELFNQILSHLNFQALAELTLVCRSFKRTCQHLIKKGIEDLIDDCDQCMKILETRAAEYPNTIYNNFYVVQHVHFGLHNVNYRYQKCNNLCFETGLLLDEAKRLINLAKAIKPMRNLFPTTNYLSTFRLLGDLINKYYDGIPVEQNCEKKSDLEMTDGDRNVLKLKNNLDKELTVKDPKNSASSLNVHAKEFIPKIKESVNSIFQVGNPNERLQFYKF